MFQLVEISNFKCFENVNLELQSTNILIGANGSGKTNFVNVFQFILDIIDQGLEEAISRQGGRNYLPHIDRQNEPITVEFTVNYPNGKPSTPVYWTVNTIKYRFSFKLNPVLKILEDELVINGNSVVDKTVPEFKDIEYKSKIILENNEYQFQTTYSRDFPMDDKLPMEYDFNKFKDTMSIEESSRIKDGRANKLLVEYGNFPFVYHFQEYMKKIGIYDFNTQLLRQINEFKTPKRLQANGSNFSKVLKEIIEDPMKKKRLLLLVRRIFPKIDTIKRNDELGNQIGYAINETYENNSHAFPSTYISDGTANILAIIISLYFENNHLVILEEPEKYIHPHLTIKVMEMIHDRSKQIQIIITTHNPELLRNSKMHDIIVTNKLSNGVSQIKRINEIDGLESFLNESIGIDQLFVRNLITWG